MKAGIIKDASTLDGVVQMASLLHGRWLRISLRSDKDELVRSEGRGLAWTCDKSKLEFLKGTAEEDLRCARVIEESKT
jgi:hypothetical protein